MKVTLHYKDDEEYYTLNESENRVEIDMHPPGKKKCQSPMELLLSATISCAAVDIVSMIKKKRKSVKDISGIAEGDRREDYPRKFTKINIHYIITSPDLTTGEASKIVDLAVEKYCSVAATINENTLLTHSFEIIN